MIQTRTAVTRAIDEPEQAVSEILEQLDLAGEGKPQAHAIGIVSCFAEYIETGVLEKLRARLPFDLAGATTIAGSAAGEIGETVLILTMLTSDDVAFATAVSDAVLEEEEAPLRACYERAAAKLPGAPTFMLSFSPLLTKVGGDYYVDRVSAISGGIPNFGTLAVDHNADYHDSLVILNGESWRDRYVMLLMSGDVNPGFCFGTISDKKLFSEKGVVTASEGNQLLTVNGAPVVEYLQSLGLRRDADGSITGINSFPIIVDYNDGTKPAVRAMFAITPEGYAVCGGNIPVGATLSIGAFDPEEILETTRRTVKEALAAGRHTFMLIYSCIGRYFAQGYNQEAEMEIVKSELESAGVPYMMAYSGGELCPVYLRDEKVINRNHNNTLIVCAF